MIASQSRDFANLAKRRRHELGLTQAEVAAEIGMTRQWVAGFERGTATGSATIEATLELFAALDISLDIRLPRQADHA